MINMNIVEDQCKNIVAQPDKVQSLQVETHKLNVNQMDTKSSGIYIETQSNTLSRISHDKTPLKKPYLIPQPTNQKAAPVRVLSKTKFFNYNGYQKNETRTSLESLDNWDYHDHTNKDLNESKYQVEIEKEIPFLADDYNNFIGKPKMIRVKSKVKRKKFTSDGGFPSNHKL